MGKNYYTPIVNVLLLENADCLTGSNDTWMEEGGDNGSNDIWGEGGVTP